MQNTFLDTNLQINLLKYLFKDKLSTIANTVSTPEFEMFYGKYDNIVDKALLDCVQSVTFEEKFNWDVVINSTSQLSFKSIHYESYTNTVIELTKSLQTTYNNINTHKFLCDWLVSQESVDIEVRKKLQSDIDWYKYKEKQCNSNLWKFYKEELIKLYLDKNFQDTFDHNHEYSIYVSNNGNTSICCELKPIIGDDYPCVLRKMIQQIEQTCKYIKNSYSFQKFQQNIIPILIIKNYNSKVTTIDKLKEIFKQHKIRVVLLSDIYDDEQETADYTLENLNRLLQKKVEILTAENETLRKQLMQYEA